MNIIKVLVFVLFCVPAVAEEQQAEAAAPVVKTILQEQLAVWPKGEAIVTTLDLPANFQFTDHYHPGEEILYVLHGDGWIIYKDDEDVYLVAGQSARIAAGKVHSGSSGQHGLKAIIFRVHPSGEPIRVEVPAAP